MIGSKVIKFNFEIQHSNWRHWHLHFTYKLSDLSHMDHNFKFLSKCWPKNWPFPAQRNKADWLHACFEQRFIKDNFSLQDALEMGAIFLFNKGHHILYHKKYEWKQYNPGNFIGQYACNCMLISYLTALFVSVQM